MLFHVYRLLLTVLSPLLVPYLLVRAATRGLPWGRSGERFGFLPASIRQERPGAIWLHAVSVGETLTAAQLLPKLRETFPDERILVSTTTPTGQRMAEEKLAAWADGFFYCPHDFPWAVRRTLRRIQPRLLIVLETEIWPNLFLQAKESGAGVLIVNGRISDRSAGRYRRLRALFARPLAACDRILTQSEQDAARFIAAGSPADAVTVGGNLKYEFPAAGNPPLELANFLRQAAPEPLILAGSTREGEEPFALAAFESLLDGYPRAVLAVAPRHPQRFDEAAELLSKSQLPVVRRSRLPAQPPAPPFILLLDSLGELSSLYPLAEVVFVGGSLNGWGGHNVIEAAAAGKPVVVGPHMQNFREIAERLIAAGSLVQIEQASELGPAWRRLLADPAEARRVGERGRAAAESQRGAARRAAEQAAEAWRAAAPIEPPGPLVRLAAAPLTGVWLAGANLHRLGYASGLRRRRRLPRPVVSIGNLTAGGVGKTPAVLRLAEQLALRGHRPAILTRGYRRRSKEPVVLSLPGSPQEPAEIGDEAYLLQQRLHAVGLDAPIGVGADRHAAGLALLEQAEIDVFLLDDGFQRHRLERDFDLVLVDVGRPLFAEPPLPLGRRREPYSALTRADAFLLTRTRPDCRYEDLERRLGRRDLQAPVYRARLAPLALEGADRIPRDPLEPAALAGKAVFAFCGVGRPEAFWRTLEELGARLVDRRALADHARYTLDDWWRLAAQARRSEAELVVTTEKDVANLSVEVPPEMRTGAPPLYALAVEQRIDDEAALLDRIETAIGNAKP